MFDLLKYSKNTAVFTDKSETLTYAQLDAVARDFMSKVSEKGLLFCLCENSIGSLVGYVSCLCGHFPIVLLDSSKNSELLQNLITSYQPEYIWLPTVKVEGVSGVTVYSYATYSLQKMSYVEPIDKPDINPELALCLTTSGSTGSPKLVRLSEMNLRSNAESIAEYLLINENERPITTLPMHYSYGLSVINSHLIAGATLLLTDATYAQREFWSFMREQKATSMSGVPYTYELLKRLHFFKMDLPDLKLMTQAGGKLNADMAKEYIDYAADKGMKFYVMYGQTEATARMSYLPWDNAQEKYSSIGIAIPGGTFSLKDLEGNVIADSNIDGELIYEGPNVSLGYAECRADLAKGDENKGTLHSGDIARRDSDGYYYITGRLKRFVKVWGNRCNLDETEQLVKAITTNCACAGIDDRITVFVTEKGLDDSIKTLLVEKTGLNNRAFDIRVVPTIPKNASGKIQYAELQNLLN